MGSYFHDAVNPSSQKPGRGSADSHACKDLRAEVIDGIRACPLLEKHLQVVLEDDVSKLKTLAVNEGIKHRRAIAFDSPILRNCWYIVSLCLPMKSALISSKVRRTAWSEGVVRATNARV